MIQNEILNNECVWVFILILFELKSNKNVNRKAAIKKTCTDALFLQSTLTKHFSYFGNGTRKGFER